MKIIFNARRRIPKPKASKIPKIVCTHLLSKLSSEELTDRALYTRAAPKIDPTTGRARQKAFFIALQFAKMHSENGFFRL
ncbi:hypothetical protein [Candidatus Chlamydia corallus]|uniref:hypothetical protein n=1 Tax=Candidatus Chlamydia corallus TaxID=2038470 RepID=UPI001865A09C|nr:hypothetical protein [Candidatus Chlamydia corallus]